MGAGTLPQPAPRALAARAGIVVALPAEARALARLRPLGRVRLSGGAEVALSGLGAVRAAATARALVADGVDGLVSWGTAAALVPALAPGDLLLPREVIATHGARHAADPDWLTWLVEAVGARARIRHGALVEVPDLLADIAAKQALHGRSRAVAADMESAAVAAVAAEFDLPFIAVRVVVDDVRMTLPPVARAAVDGTGALRPLAMTRALIGRPRAVHTQLRALKQLAVAFKAARNTLGQVAPCLLGKTGQ